MSSRSDIENIDKEYDERDQIDMDNQQEKKIGEHVEEVLTGSNEVYKLGIMSSGSSIDKGSDERDQIDNDDKIEKNIYENDEEAFIGDI